MHVGECGKALWVVSVTRKALPVYKFSTNTIHLYKIWYFLLWETSYTGLSSVLDYPAGALTEAFRVLDTSKVVVLWWYDVSALCTPADSSSFPCTASLLFLNSLIPLRVYGNSFTTISWGELIVGLFYSCQDVSVDMKCGFSVAFIYNNENQQR